MIKNIMVRGKLLFPRSSLPNSDGFRFLGYNTDGQKFRCEVVKDANGLHRVEGMKFSEMIGWTDNLGDDDE